MYINSFLTELTKKIETVELQLKDFDDKIETITSVKNLIVKKTLKNINEINGTDLVNLTKDDFVKILEVFKFDNPDDKLKMFFNSSSTIKINQKLLDEGNDGIDSLEIEKCIEWLNLQAKYIKEYISDFNDNNKEFYNSLKSSDNLYKKYMAFFKNSKMIKPIFDMEEFNEVIKKTGIITSDKWQLIKYVTEKNLEFHKKSVASGKTEKIEYSEEEIIAFVENILINEKQLIVSIDNDKLKYAFKLIELDEEEIAKIELDKKDLLEYQKMPILDSMNTLYLETKEMLKEDLNSDAIKIEKNFKKLKDLVESYDVLAKID